MDLKTSIELILQQLGGTADEVAAILRAQGVQGVRNAVRGLNPVVRFIQNAMQLDNFDGDVMTGTSLRVRTQDGKLEVELPQSVRDFLQAFNRGTYPDLELPPSKT